MAERINSGGSSWSNIMSVRVVLFIHVSQCMPLDVV